MKNLFKSASAQNCAKFVWQHNAPANNYEDYSEKFDTRGALDDLKQEISKNQESKPAKPYQERSKYGKEMGARDRNKYDITKIKSREDAYDRANDVLEDHFNPDNEGGYDANNMEWGLNEKSRTPEAKDNLKALQYMLNFIHKYSPTYKGQIPQMFYTENVDGFLKDSRGISNTQAAIREVNSLFKTGGSRSEMEEYITGEEYYENNQITVSEELMTKLRAEVRRILENNEKGGTHVLDKNLDLLQKEEQKEMMADVLNIRLNEVDDRWFNWMKKITPESANDTYKNDFDKYGEYEPGILDSSLENDLEKKLSEPYTEPKTQSFIKWLGTPDGQEFLSGKNEKTDDKWSNFGEYVKYKKAHDRRQASVDFDAKKYEGMA